MKKKIMNMCEGQSLVIESTHPIPPDSPRQASWRWKKAVLAMDVGDSFLIEDCNDHRLNSLNQAFKRQGRRCRSEKYKDGSRRFWRIEDE